MPRLCYRVRWLVGVFLTLLWILGCTPPPPAVVPVVQGVVTYDGRPVWRGRVTFLGAGNRISTVEVDEQGHYRLQNPPLGRVRVGVTNHPRTINPGTGGREQLGRPGVAHTEVPPLPHLALPERYGEPFESGLVMQIEPGETQHDIALKRLPDDPPYLARTDLPDVGVEPGQTAPDIVGPDLEGQPLRLREQRGKVVALLFWGYW
ncbi:MAG: hypothetical protein U0840_01525 [Gemmataceae bacterium]